MQGWHLKQLGWTQRDIAVALDVSEAAVSKWMASAREWGPSALLAHPSPGHPPKLDPAERRLIPDCLWHGAEAYGFRGDVWTCARIAWVIREEFGVLYHPGHVSRLLKQLGWTPQIPIIRAIQRDRREIEHWRSVTWPKLKTQAAKKRQTPIFVDEAGFYLLPGVVKTYAPKGLTPILREWQTRDHLSVMAGLTPDGRVYVLIRQESLNGLHTVEFLKHIMRHVGRKLLVIWDRSPIHRRTEIKQFLEGPQGQDVQVEPLPAYAPDLNPLDAGAWQHLKHVEMRNLACLDLEDLHLELSLAIDRLRHKPHLIQSFYKAAGLTI
jgi:transposase